MTTLVHGAEACDRAQVIARALFTGEVRGLDATTLAEALPGIPSTAFTGAAPAASEIVDVLVTTGLAQSRRQAREFLDNGSISVNGAKIGAGHQLSDADVLAGGVILLRRGKKQWHATVWG